MTRFPKNANLLKLWILVTAFGILVGYVIIFGFVYSNVNWITTVPVGIATIGILVGVGQWAVLRIHLKKVWMWIPLTAIGIPFGFILGYMIDPWPHITSIVAGTVLGVPQWLVLYRKVENSIWWIPASTLSWTIGFTISEFTLEALMNIGFNFLSSEVISGIVFGVLVGIISGFSITFLMGKSSAKNAS